MNETMAKKNVAEVLVDVLVEAGVQRIYGVAGDSLNGITDTLRPTRTDSMGWPETRGNSRVRRWSRSSSHNFSFVHGVASAKGSYRVAHCVATTRRRSSSCFLRSCSHTRSPDHRELSAPLEPAAGARWLARNFLDVHGRNCTSEAHMEGEPADDRQALLSIAT